MPKSSTATKPNELTLTAFLNAEVEGGPKQGMSGEESDWLDLEEKIEAAKGLQLIDASSFGQRTDGAFVMLPKGSYGLQVRIMSFGRDRRVSRLRICSDTNSALGKQIGEVAVDSAIVLCFDKIVIDQLAPDRRRLLANFFTGIQMSDTEGNSTDVVANVVQAPAGNILWSNTGFGDGTYPIFELKSGAKRVGFEIEFIKANAPYPFEVRGAAQTVAHAGEELHWSKIEDIWDPAWEAMKKDDAHARAFFKKLTPGQKALLAIDIFNKALLHMGGINDVFLAFRPVIPEEILGGYRRLGAESHAAEFGKLVRLLKPVLEEKDHVKKLKLWTKAMASNIGKQAREIEDWFRANMEAQDCIETFIASYISKHANEFPIGRSTRRAKKS